MHRTKMVRHLVQKKKPCNEKKRYHCDICDVGFKQKEYLVRHQLNKHSENKPQFRFACLNCRGVLATKYNLNSHYKRVHPKVKIFEYKEFPLD